MKEKKIMEKLNGFYPNQKQVHINKNQVMKNSGLAYACIYRYSMENAMINLKPSTFKIWLWFVSNKPNYTTEYSPAYLSKTLKVSINTCKSAFSELMEKGYIVESLNNKHHYEFYETPQNQGKINFLKEEREFIDNETGEIFNLTYAELLENVGNEVEARQIWEDAL